MPAPAFAFAPAHAPAPSPFRSTRSASTPACVLAHPRTASAKRPRRKPHISPAPPAPPIPPAPSAPPLAPDAAAAPRLFEELVSAISALATSRGALGRGTRACLRAFYRRASFLVSTQNDAQEVYIEIGPAYVLSTARLSRIAGRVSRYSVEQRAWPALRATVNWEEVTAAEARGRGALLRHLKEGGRFGRHLFVPYDSLAALIRVAEDVLELDIDSADGFDEWGALGKRVGGDSPWAAMEVEAVVNLRRKPLPGVRTVAARCPRRAAHANGDRKPSLMLWMNRDGITGGAMCPVCTDEEAGVIRQMTWRVHYLPENNAVLCTPIRRVRSPQRVEEALAEYKRNFGEGHDLGTGNTDAMVKEEIALDTGQVDLRKGSKGAVGGNVLQDREKVARVGEVIGMAYVTASLRILTTANTTGEVSLDGTRTRTVGTMASQRCPMQVLLWSDRRSKGPTSSKRVEEVAWFARQATEMEDTGTTDVLESEEWMPTPLVSVSAMRPSGWRDVTSTSGRLLSVPASWEASAQSWVLFDIDDIEGLWKENVVNKSANKMALAVRRNQELSGRCLIMQTGPTGLHVWAELREVRDNPRVWFQKDEVRSWYADVGTRLLQATHRAGSAGGKIDMSSCSAGRFARRPGWRILEDGSLFRSCVVMYVPSTVRKRAPRPF